MRLFIVKKNEKVSFEARIGRLEEIVRQVESGGTPLDTAISLYKEGIDIASGLGQSLKKYEAEVMVLQKKADETFSVEPFEEGP